MRRDSTISLHTGREMPVLGLGTWQLTVDTAGTIARAVEIGYRMIDTSGDYGTQPGIGEALRQEGIAREAVYLVTKVEEDDDPEEATQRNLSELGLGYVDLILIHRPPPNGVGLGLWEGLLSAREQGLVRDVGVSNYRIDQMRELIESTGEKPVVNQIEWSPFGHDERMRGYSRDNSIVIQAYSPLTRAQRLDDGKLSEIAQRYGATSAQLLIRWNLQRGTVPLPKANQVDHLVENLGAFDFEIDDEGMDQLTALNEHYSSLGGLPYV